MRPLLRRLGVFWVGPHILPVPEAAYGSCGYCVGGGSPQCKELGGHHECNSMYSSRTVILITSDKHRVTVNTDVAAKSLVIARLLDDCSEDVDCPEIPLPQVSSTALAHILTIIVGDLEPVFASKEELYELVIAANYLHVREALDFACEKVADIVRGKSVEDIRSEFNIESRLTPEDDARLRATNLWAFS